MTPHEPGLQAERTALAWSRTGLAMLVNALLVIREGWHAQHLAVTLQGCALLIAAAATWFYAMQRQRQLSSTTKRPAAPVFPIAAVSLFSFFACLMTLV